MDREGNPRAIKSCSSLPISFLHQPPAHACTDSLCSFCAESSAIHRHDVDTNTNYRMLLARRHAIVSVHTPHTFKPTLEAMHHWLCVLTVCPLHAYFGRVVSDRQPWCVTTNIRSATDSNPGQSLPRLERPHAGNKDTQTLKISMFTTHAYRYIDTSWLTHLPPRELPAFRVSGGG